MTTAWYRFAKIAIPTSPIAKSTTLDLCVTPIQTAPRTLGATRSCLVSRAWARPGELPYKVRAEMTCSWYSSPS
jgi:hypothetical protein